MPDDVWSYEVWDSIKSFFPDQKIGSCIMLTTREKSVANYACQCITK